MSKTTDAPRRIARYSIAILTGALAYVLSSGPVLATAFRLRDATHWDGFYAVLWVYYPLLAFRPMRYLFDGYISWWCWLFGAVGPG